MTESTNGSGAPATSAANILELRDIRAGYDAIEILHGVSLAVAQGTVFGLLGPNGAGKTTLLRVAAGLHRPTHGDLLVAGRRINDVRPDDLARAGVCTLPEGRGIFPNLTVRENLWMSTYRGVAFADVEERAYARFPRLKERRSQPAGTLSGGEQQMLAVARAIATEPALLLLDELSMGLAPLIVGELYQIVRQIAAEGVSVLVVEQFAKTVLGVADVAAIMTQGQIVRVGSPADLERELETAYLGGDPVAAPPKSTSPHSVLEGEAGTP